MAILRFDPFRDPFHEFDRLTSQLRSGTRMPLAMPMDVWKGEKGYVVELDLPGVDPASIELTCERNELTVKAERRPSFEQGDEVVVAERPQGSFTRQLVLGDGVGHGERLGRLRRGRHARDDPSGSDGSAAAHRGRQERCHLCPHDRWQRRRGGRRGLGSGLTAQPDAKISSGTFVAAIAHSRDAPC